MDENFESALKIANHKHDLILIKTTDPLETQLPSAGLMLINDLETNEQVWIDASDADFIKQYNKAVREKNMAQYEMFNKHGIDNLTINTTEDYIKPLKKLFKQRGARG
jgi:hypothetical protein